MVKMMVIAAAIAALSGCTTPMGYTNAPMTSFDKDTEYAVVERPGGFTLTVHYGRYQFIPESGALAASCKAALTSIAHEVAERKGRAIEPVNEQRIQLSMGRNGLTGMTTCTATVPVTWKA